MILVTVGTNEAPFDRLVGAVASLAAVDSVVLQRGHSGLEPDGVRAVDFLPFEELASLARDAETIVTHAGVGSILLSLTCGKVPLVVPRLKLHGEAVDDHQVSLAQRLGEAGLVRVVDDVELLVAAVSNDAPDKRRFSAPGGQLALHVRSYLISEVGLIWRGAASCR